MVRLNRRNIFDIPGSDSPVGEPIFLLGVENGRREKSGNIDLPREDGRRNGFHGSTTTPHLSVSSNFPPIKNPLED